MCAGPVGVVAACVSRLRPRWARCAAGWGAVLLALAVSNAASAAAMRLSWSARMVLSTASTPIYGVSCPSATECTAFGTDRITTFDPRSRQIVASAVPDPNAYVAAISCPTRTQCTTVDQQGIERTFDPRSPSSSSSLVIDNYHLLDVACPSASQCTAVDYQGREVTFDPATQTTMSALGVSQTIEVSAVTCPSTHQCTAIAVGNGHEEVTFDPTSRRIPRPHKLGGHDFYWSIACPSHVQCTAVDALGREVTFDPLSSRRQSAGRIDKLPVALAGTTPRISCPTVSFCVVVDRYGNASQGNPQKPHSFRVGHIKSASQLDGLSCGSINQCVAVDSTGAFTGTRRR